MKNVLIAMTLMPLMVLADTELIDGIEWSYCVREGEAYVIDIPKDTIGAIEIPSILGGCYVVGIEFEAFLLCEDLTSVIIPFGVKRIGDYAFMGCSGLISVTIPSSVTEIESGVFASCGSLSRINIDSIPAWCAIKWWGKPQPSDYELYLNGKKIIDLIIPDGVTSVRKHAFYMCSGLKSVTISSSVTNIGVSAFSELDGLTSVTIPANISSIASSVFANNKNLKDVYFEGTKLPSIDADAFSGCDPDLVFHAPKGYTGRSRIVAGTYLVVDGESGNETSTVNVLVTNVVVQHVLNSVMPQFAIPATSDTGFVNIITAVKGGCVAVPATWTINYPKFTEKFGNDFTKSLAMQTGKKDGAGNPMFVWQDYVAGTDPTDETDVFTASITIVDGKVQISYSPELDDARKALRKYTTWGKKSLMDTKWTEVQEGSEAEFNFFKVSVEMR